MNRARILATYQMPLLLMTIIIALDQWTKQWALGALSKPVPWCWKKITLKDGTEASRLLDVPLAEAQRLLAAPPEGVSCWANSREGHVEVFQSWFWLRYAENRAAAFSLTESIPEWFRMPMLISVSLLAVVGVLWWLWKLTPEQIVLRVALGLVLGGAIGNLIDRVSLGYVIDFIDWHLRPAYGWRWTFPTFNIADSAVVCGGALILIFGGKTAAEDSDAPPEEEPPEGDSEPPSDDEAFTAGAT